MILAGIANQRGAVGSPESAGRGLAIGGLEDAGGDLGRRQNRAVQNVERDRAGGNLGLEPLEAVGAANIRRLDRRLSDDVDDTTLRGVGDAFAGKLSLSMVAVLSSPEICKRPDLPLSMSGRPATLAIPGEGPAFTPLAPAAASFADEPGLLCLAGATFAPCGSAGAAPGSINCAMGLACRESGG